MRQTRGRFLAIAIVLAALLPHAARADDVSEFKRLQGMQKSNLERFFNQAPELDKSYSRAIADLFSLSLSERGVLVLRTNLPSMPAGQLRKVKLDTDADWSMLNVINGATGAGPVVPTGFTLNRIQFGPQSTDSLVVEQEKGASFNITHQTITPAGRQTLEFVMQHPSAMVPSSCELVIMNQPTSRQMIPQSWSSPDFSAFTREHPAEVDRYIRPLLHQLGQDAALAPDPMLTFEVFADHWTPDPATTAKVNVLVAALGSGDFHARAHAQHDLSALGKDGALVLMRLDRTKLTAEQNARIDKVMDPIMPVSADEAKTLGSDPGFLLNCLYSDDLAIRKIAFAQLQSITKLKLTFDPAAGASTRNPAIPVLLQQLIDAKVIVPKP